MSSSIAIDSGAEKMWGRLKSNLLMVVGKVCRFTKTQWRHEQNWWWNAAVDSTVKEQQKWRKTWKKITARKSIINQASCQACYLEESQAEQEFFKELSPSSSDLFFLAIQMRHGNMVVQGEKPACNDAGELCLEHRVRQADGKEHYERLPNMEFDWDPVSLKEINPVEGTDSQMHESVCSPKFLPEPFTTVLEALSHEFRTVCS